MAGMARNVPTMLEKSTEIDNEKMKGSPRFNKYAWVYAPMPRKAACPRLTSPVYPVSSINPIPAMA